jgi:hypothetical protein
VFRLFPSLGVSSAGHARSMIDVGLNDRRSGAVIENREIRSLGG